jgi:CRP-like cAMP-binding protein
MGWTARGRSSGIHIRAVRGWPASHGQEAPELVLTSAHKTELARFGEVVEYKTKGARIFLQGTPADFLYLLTEGVVRAYHILANGERQILAFLWPGDLFGLAEHGAFVNSAETVTPCVVHRFPLDRLETFLLTNPSLQESFLVKAVHDLRNTQRQIIVMGRFDVQHRLAAFLLDCSGHEHYFSLSRKMLTLPMSRYDIADYLGTSAETVTRAFGQLEENGLIQRSRARAIVLKPSRLRSYVRS